MIAVIRFRPAADLAGFQEQAHATLRAFAARPGYLGGTFGRAVDDAELWALVTEWESVGAYRRGLGGYEVKLAATMLMADAVDEPTAFEALLRIGADGTETAAGSDRADGAGGFPR